MRYHLKQLKNIVAKKRFIALVVLCAVGGYAFISWHSSKQFDTGYIAYVALARVQGEAAYLPAAPNNPVRQQLNLVLSEMLQPGISSSKRLSDAKLGLNLLAQLETQIDAIGSTSEAANNALAKLQVAFSSGFTSNNTAYELIDLAKQRSAVIEDIRGLSYRADFDTRTIFDRIITDRGALTKTHINDLNNEIPEIETQFDRRTNSYTELQTISTHLDTIAASLGPDTSASQISQ